MEVGSDNRAVVSGFPDSGSAGAAFIKVDEDGDLLWSNLDADGPQMLLMHAHMLLDGSNNAHLAASNPFSMAVCKVNSNGTSGWTATVSGSSASAIALGDRDRNVFVVGGATARLNNGPAGNAPGAPSGLTSGLLTPTAVELRFTDNASNETGFALERCLGSLAFCQATPALFTIRATLGANVTAHTDSALLAGTQSPGGCRRSMRRGARPTRTRSPSPPLFRPRRLPRHRPT